MRKSISAFLVVCILLTASSFSVLAQTTDTGNDSGISVWASKWSKVKGVVHYSDWMEFKGKTTDILPGFNPVAEDNLTKYGSNPDIRRKATGFFYTEKIGDRWWIVDPEGFAGINAGVNGVRPGKSERNITALTDKFGSLESWADTTQTEIASIYFNGTACWSDVPLMQHSNFSKSKPLAYTQIWNFYSGYQRERKKIKKDSISFAVFDPAFEVYCKKMGKKISESKNDPNLLGHFSDNELPFSEDILDEYLSSSDLKDPNKKAALKWLADKKVSANMLTDSIRSEFTGYAASKYFKTVKTVLKKSDPNHMYLGCRFHGRPKNTESLIKAAAKYTDIISINYYGYWEPVSEHFEKWAKWADKPVIITEFYTKGDDSGMPNISGAGWRVKTQNDRGIHYENFCMGLLQMKNCVGWHWFRYMDNDPTDLSADQSNNDSNKGLVDNYYQYYTPLTDHMKKLNRNRYALINYFESLNNENKK
jgi:hypothetical protein